jgi:hypothetical protein
LARRTSDENAGLAWREQSVDLRRLERSYVTPDEGGVIVALERISAILVDIDAADDVEPLLAKAVGEADCPS